MENMEQNTNTQESGENGSQEAGKTFTQEEVNKIVQDRLARQQAKVIADQNSLEEREKALAIRELKADAREELRELGLPECTADILNFSSKKEYEQSLEAVQRVLAEYSKAREIERATGRTPKSYSSGKPVDQIAEAFQP